eukprot:2517648-Rhodomonas_salina.1
MEEEGSAGERREGNATSEGKVGRGREGVMTGGWRRGGEEDGQAKGEGHAEPWHRHRWTGG